MKFIIKKFILWIKEKQFKNTFVCFSCKKRYKKAWEDEEAINELEETFGYTDTSNCCLVCDDCYKKIINK